MITPLFVEKLIKGRIAEIVFEMMFRQAGHKVTHFGYEYIAAELLRDEIRELEENKEILKDIRNSPDFIVITPDNRLYFIEVKFQANYWPEKILKMAHKTHARWDHAWYFIATKEGFYFTSCNAIIEQKGNAIRLPEDIIPKEVQQTYLDLINLYIPANHKD